METLAGLWMPILVSAVLVFVASSLVWNVLGAHKWHIRGLPDEAGVREALSRQPVAPGMYTIPYSSSPAAFKDPKAWAGDVRVLAAPSLISLVNHFRGAQTLSPPRPGPMAARGAR